MSSKKELSAAHIRLRDTLLELSVAQGASVVEIAPSELATLASTSAANVSRDLRELADRTNKSIDIIAPGKYKVNATTFEGVASEPDVAQVVQQLPSRQQTQAHFAPRPTIKYDPKLPTLVEASSWMMRNFKNFEFEVMKEAGVYIPSGTEAREAFLAVRKQLITLLDLPLSEWTVAKVKEAGKILVEELRSADTRESFVNIPELNDRVDTTDPVDTVEYWLDQLLSRYPGTGPRSSSSYAEWVKPAEDDTWDDGVKMLQRMVRTKYGFDVMLSAINKYRALWLNGGGEVTFIKPLVNFLRVWTTYVSESKRIELMSVQDQKTYITQQESTNN